MGVDDIEHGRSKSPSYPMLNRGLGEARRRIVLLGLLCCFLVLTLVAFRRQEQIKDIINDSRTEWTHSNSSGSLKQPPVEEKAKAPQGEKEAAVKPKKDKSKPSIAKAPVLGNGERSLSDESLVDLRNETLGFEKIYVLNVPGRTDKLDAMRLTSSLTGFTFDVIEGISGKDVPKKALSGDFNQLDSSDGIIGCWRGHMNFASTILKNRLASALIMEDDADWDVNFRSQMELFALGSQTLLDSPKNSAPHSPYGDGWDLIWLGHCASQPADDDNRRFLMKNDPTTTPPKHRTNFGGVPDMSMYDTTTRVMYFSKGSTCTYAYALSFRGAQKVLKYLSMDIYNKPVDFGLHDMCSHKDRGFKCIGVFPQIVGDHKPAGGALKDSDIGSGGDKPEQVREEGFSYNVVHSTRLNVNLLIDGKREQAKSQWPEDTPTLTGPVETEFREDPVESTVE